MLFYLKHGGLSYYSPNTEVWATIKKEALLLEGLLYTLRRYFGS